MSSEIGQPDELYTLRTQFFLGHYQAALQEAKQMSRRPLSTAALKLEREEFIYRSYIALQQYDKCVSAGDNPGIQALVCKAEFEAAVGNEALQSKALNELKSLASSHPTIVTVQLCAAQVNWMAGEIAAAYPLLCTATTNHNPECLALKIQMLLKIDRLDLAQKEFLHLQRVAGDDSVLVELAGIYIALATGRSKAADAEHTIMTLSEQYGPSVYLLNLLATAAAIQGNFTNAEAKLQGCLRDFDDITAAQRAETLVNLVCVLHQQPTTKAAEAAAALSQLQALQPPTLCSQQFLAHYELVVSAYDREAARYMTA